MLNDLELTGRARTHVVQVEDLRCALHRDVLEPFLALRTAAARDGIDLKVFSAFRDFSAQLSIWNRKFSGQRPLYTRDGAVLEHASLGVDELLEAILHWSALPGASRHHWGSDIDVFDAAAIAPDYRVQLLPEEFAEAGPFERLNHWLAQYAAQFGFFRPYDRERGGVYPEPWHISHAPVAVPALNALTPAVIAHALQQAEILGQEAVVARLDAIYQDYVVNVGRPEFV
jgi:LAS superfamily LD-carboxypeptidase LdcB